MAAYKYTSLPANTWLRLVTIHPELDDGKISCSLEHFDSSALCPAYAALSYKWGDPTPRHAILINGGARLVHKNLWQYLLQARGTRETAHLWIDSICLDQDNHAEKNEQVPRMGDIYSAAEFVISWLGSDAPGIEALGWFGSMKDTPLSFYGYPWIADKDEDENEDEDHERYLRTRALRRLLIDEGYWNRIWVQQEILCASKCIVCCGTASVEMTELVQAVTNTITLTHRPEWSVMSFHTAEVWAKGWKNTQFFRIADLQKELQLRETVELWHLCTKMSDCESGRKSDRVFGLLGLAQRFDPSFDLRLLDVNYDKSLEHVFWDMIFMSMETTGRLIDDNILLDMLSQGVSHASGSCEVWRMWSSLKSYAVAGTTRQQRRQTATIAIQPAKKRLGIHRYLKHWAALRYPKYWAVFTRDVIWHLNFCGQAVQPMDSRLRLYTRFGLQLSQMVVMEAALAGFAEAPKSIDTIWLCAAHLPAQVRERHVHLQLGKVVPLDGPIQCSAAQNDQISCDNAFAVCIGGLGEPGVDIRVQNFEPERGFCEIGFFCSSCMMTLDKYEKKGFWDPSP